jgi:hypothetical protein
VAETTQIYSVGHSTRSQDDFMELLRSFQIVQLADIRTLPGSKRYPQFAKVEGTRLTYPAEREPGPKGQ